MGLGAIGTGGSNWAKKGSVPDIPVVLWQMKGSCVSVSIIILKVIVVQDADALQI